MKAITIYQPWASLIAFGEKQYETRHWPIHYRGEIAIHAGKKIPPRTWNMMLGYPFKELLEKHGIMPPTIIPRGAVVAIAELMDCIPAHELRKIITPLEESLGDFRNGRFGWKLANVRPIPPVEMRGQQGLWEAKL